MITITSLRHPTMIERLNLALKLSSSSLGGGVTQYVVRDFGGNQIGCYSYASSAELKAFMHSRGN